MRETLLFTQDQLAEKAQISVSYLSMIERGQRTPHVETLVSLASALHVTVSQLFLEANEESGGHDLPLMAYLGSRGLDPKQLDALLKVAKAMFDGKP